MNSNVCTLKVFLTFSRDYQASFIRNAPKQFIIFLCECIVNILAGKLKITKNKVIRFKRQMKTLAQKKPSISERRIILSSDNGIRLINMFASVVIERSPPC